MTNNLLKIGGGVVFWTLAKWHNRGSLKQALENLDLERYIPPVRGNLQALRDSLNEVFPRHSVEYTLGKKFYQVDQIVRKEDEVEHRKVCIASISEHGQISLAPWDYEQTKAVVTSFNKHLGLVTGDAVSQSLIRYCDHLGGTRLRPVGGIYWLPEDQLPSWNAVTDAVQRAAVGTSTCYLIRHNMDADAVKAVRDAICAEITTGAAHLKSEIESGELSEKQIENRRGLANNLRHKVKLYEEILGVALDQLHTSLDQAEQASATAAILELVAGSLEEANEVPA